MYLIKNIYLNRQTGEVKVENGIRVAKLDGHNINVVNPYWGEAETNVGCFSDLSKLTAIDEKYLLLSYVNEYIVTDMEDGFKKIWFNLSSYKRKGIEGYIIFLRHEDDIKTNGEKIFGRYPTEMIVVLREGQYLDFSGKHVKMIDGLLMVGV